MITEEELIKNYFETKKLIKKYEEQLAIAKNDTKIPNYYYLDDIDDRNVVNGLEFQICRLTDEIMKMEKYANEVGITLIEPTEKTR